MANKTFPTRYAIVTDYVNGDKVESVFYKDGNKIRHKTVINGETFGYKVDTVYKVHSDEPYIRDCGYYFKLTDEYLLAVRSLLED